MNKKQGRRRSVSRSEVRLFLGKAEEWLETAVDALAHEHSPSRAPQIASAALIAA